MSGLGKIKSKLFSRFWIRKPILDIYKCPKRESGFRNGPKRSPFFLSEHNGLVF